MTQIITLSPSREKSLLWSLSGIQFSHILDVIIVMPLAPMLMRTFTLTAAQFGMLVAVYSFAAAISSILSAMVVDRFDRRRVVLTLFAAFIVATLLCAAAPTYHLLLFARGLSGVFGGVLGSMIHVYVADCFPYERRGFATGRVTAAFSVATVLGVPLGLLLVNHTPLLWRAPFIMIAFLASVFWVMAYRAIPSIPTRLTDHRWSQALMPMKQVFSHPNHWPAFALMFLLVMGGFTVIPYITLYCTLDLHFPEKLLPVMYLTGGAFTFFTSRWFGRLADAYGKARIFRTVSALAMLPILGITNASHLPWWGVLMITTPFFIFVSGRFVPGMAIISSASVPNLRGTFMGINSAVQSIAASIATFAGGCIITVNAQGSLQHYNIVGCIACTAILTTLWLVGRIKVAVVS